MQTGIKGMMSWGQKHIQLSYPKRKDNTTMKATPIKRLYKCDAKKGPGSCQATPVWQHPTLGSRFRVMEYIGVKGLRNLSLQLKKGLGGHGCGRGISAYSLGKAIVWSCEDLAMIKLEMPRFWRCKTHAISVKKSCRQGVEPT